MLPGRQYKSGILIEGGSKNPMHGGLKYLVVERNIDIFIRKGEGDRMMLKN